MAVPSRQRSPNAPADAGASSQGDVGHSAVDCALSAPPAATDNASASTRRGDMPRHSVWIGALFQEGDDLTEIATARQRDFERCAALLVLRLQVGAALDEELDDQRRAAAGNRR